MIDHASRITTLWSIRINTYYKELILLNSTSFNDFTNLGDFVISMYSKDLEWIDYVYQYFLSPAISRDTKAELSQLLTRILQELIGEPEITWNLADAADMFVTTGKLIQGSFASSFF